MVYETLLRHPEGQYILTSKIIPHIKPNATLFNPFFTDGKLELSYLKNNPNSLVLGSSLYKPMSDFWMAVMVNPDRVAQILEQYYPISETFLKHLRSIINDPKNGLDYFQNGALYYILNRCNFIDYYDPSGFTRECISQIRYWDYSIKLSVRHSDYRVSIPSITDAFLYLTPPTVSKDGFSHLELFELIKDRKDWVLVTNDTLDTLELYKGFPTINIGQPLVAKTANLLITSK